jgi:type IV pilus assembly protein PilE
VPVTERAPPARGAARGGAAGFSLIELMITISIIGILAAIAYPSFTRYVQRSRRSDATSTMLQDAQILQRCYSQNFSYLAACAGAPIGVNASSNGYYTVNVNPDTQTHYLITATAVGTQLNDLQCRTYTLDSAGTQTATDSGGAANTQTCWGSN